MKTTIDKAPYTQTCLGHKALRAALAACCAAITALVAGCAGVEHSAISSKAEDAAATGIRYYDSSPYLLVQTDNQGGLKSELVYLPDPAKKRQAKPFSRLASNSSSLSFTNGMLAEASADVDATAIPAAIIGALQNVVQAAAKGLLAAANRPEATNRAPSVYLFKIVKSTDASGAITWRLIGAEGQANAF